MTDKLNREELIKRAQDIAASCSFMRDCPRCSSVFTDRETEQAANLLNEIAALLSARQEQAEPTKVLCNDPLCDKTLMDRDRYHDMADRLADGIAKHFGVEIGEHSSNNCPWTNALEWVESSQPQEPIKASADEREAFEKWASDPVRAEKLPLDRWPANDGYKDQRTYATFYGWQARAALSIAQPAALNNPVEVEFVKKEAIGNVIGAIAELPDRTSPEDWPEAMLVTADELRDILEDTFVPVAQPAAQTAVPETYEDLLDKWEAVDAECGEVPSGGIVTYHADAFNEGFHLSAAPQPVAAQDYETQRAIMESARYNAGEEYFNARPHMASLLCSRVAFNAGFQRGFDAAHPQAAQAKGGEDA
jgi:hypothetical protein